MKNVTKKELVARVTQIVRRAGYRKSVKLPKHSFIISDEEGNSSCFDVSGKVKPVTLDEVDVTAVIEACLKCVWETLARGDSIKINGLGTLGVKTKAQTVAPDFKGGTIVIPERRAPFFRASNKLKAIAKMSCEENREIPYDIRDDFDDLDEFDLDGDSE